MSFLDVIDRTLFSAYQALGFGVFSSCAFSAPSKSGYFLMDGGGIMSMIEIEGVYQHQTLEGEDGVLNALDASLRGLLKEPGRVMQVMFSYDPRSGKTVANDFLGDMRRSAKARGLDMSYLLDDMAEYIGRHISREKLLIAMWTLPMNLSAQQRKDFAEELKKSPAIPTGPESAPLKMTNMALETAHEKFVKGAIAGFEAARIKAVMLSKEEALKAVRAEVDPEMTTREWEPTFYTLLKRQTFTSEEFLNHGFFSMPLPGTGGRQVYIPSLKKQVIPRDADILDDSFVKIGSRLHMPLYLALAPQQVQRFNRLLNELRKQDCAFRLLWNLKSGEMGTMRVSIQKFCASVLGFLSDDNKKINKVYKELAQQELEGGMALVGFQGVFDVWVDVDGTKVDEAMKRLRSSVSTFIGAMNMWGTQEIRDATGDPWQAFCAGIPGMTLKGPMQTCIGSLRDILDMMPFFRAYSPWNTGGLRRTPDGKPYPYLQNSSKQTSWLTLGVAPMGGGKSVALNLENLEFLLSAGKTEIPYLRIVDFGFSSRGVINLIRYSLPDDQKDLAIYTKLRNDLDHAVNFFDTPLCTRYPGPTHKAFIVDLLTLFCTPLGDMKPPDGVESFVTVLVEKVYDAACGAEAKKYEHNLHPEVDAMLPRTTLSVDRHTTWREVADALFVAKRYNEALVAHREAMPLLSTAINMCTDDRITQGFQSVIINGSEKVFNYVSRKLHDALRIYPVFGAPTKFGFGNAKIISLDLEEVARGGAAAQSRQAGIFYLLAWHLLSSTFMETPEDVKNMPEFTREYHMRRISSMKELPKKICIDEAHRIQKAGTDLSAVFMRHLDTTIRESRKHRILVTMMTQSFTDYDPHIHELASAFYVFGAGNNESMKGIAETYGLGEAGIEMQEAIPAEVGPEGSVLMAFYKADKNVAHNIMITIGPSILWSFSTTAEDVALRDFLYSRNGVRETLQFLGSEYPGGVKKLLEKKTAEYAKSEIHRDAAEDLRADCLKQMKEMRKSGRFR